MTATAEPDRSRRLWLGVLLAPAAWMVAEGVGYVLVSRLCEPASRLASSTADTHAKIAQAVVCGLCLLIAVAGLFVAIENWREVRAATGPREGRMMFMAVGGAFTSAVFAMGIVMFAAPSFIVNVCNQAL
jgi:hypothetical protein